MYPELIIPTILIPTAAMLIGALHFKDSLHPLVYLGAMLLSLYGLMPVYLSFTDGIYFHRQFFSDEDLYFVLLVNLLGVSAMLLGVFMGSGQKRIRRSNSLWSLAPGQLKRIRRAAIYVGFVGVAMFAYVRPGLGGWSESGYARDAYLLTVPALLWLMVSFQNSRPRTADWIRIAIIAAPLFLLALFNARRGPMFMIVVGLAVGWYFMRNRRPSLRTVVLGGVMLGAVLLALVVNRESIRQGEFSLENPISSFTSARSGNEFIYGAGQILTYAKTGNFMWGRQYIVDFIIRPIPKQIWPTKYEDAWDFLGVPNLFQGGPGAYFTTALSWRGEKGAAPGIIADLWWEFSWFYLVVVWGLGWFYGRIWRNAAGIGGYWVPLFGIVTSLSLYLTWQALEAFGFRFLVMAAGSWVVWRYSVRNRRRRLGAHRVQRYPGDVPDRLNTQQPYKR
jgi:hypothetical protein